MNYLSLAAEPEVKQLVGFLRSKSLQLLTGEGAEDAPPEESPQPCSLVFSPQTA